MYRLVIVLVAAGCLSFVTVGQAAPDWSRRQGLDFWNFQALVQKEDKALLEGQDLDTRQRWLKEHIDAVDNIVEQLVNGNLSLVEAVRETLYIQQDRPEWIANCKLGAPTVSNEAELTALALIRKVAALRYKPTGFPDDEEQDRLISFRLTELKAQLVQMSSSSPVVPAAPR